MELVPRISPGPVDGRADLAGAGRRLPLRARGGDAAAALLPAVHDRGRHRPAGARCSCSAPVSPGCRRSPRPSGSGAVVSAYDVRPRQRRRGPLDGRHVHRPRPGGRSRAPAATPGSWPRTAPTGSRSCSRRTSRRPTCSSRPRRCPGRRRPAAGHRGDAGRHEARAAWSSTSRRSPAATSRARSPGEDLAVDGPGGVVRCVGMKDAASTMPADASRLYAKNVANLLLLMTEDGERRPRLRRRGRRRRLPHPRRRGPARADRRAARRQPGTERTPDGRHRPARDLRAGGVRRLRGGLEGLDARCTPR